MSTLKVTNLRHSSASSDAITLASDGTATAKITSRAGRNVLVNGAMRVSQKGTSESSVTGSGYHLIDTYRFVPSSIGAWTVSQDSESPTQFSKSYKLDCTTAESMSGNNGSRLRLIIRLEGNTLQSFNKGTADAKPFAISFWTKTNKAGTYVVRLTDQDNSRHCSGSYTVSSGEASGQTWVKREIVLPADTTGAFDDDNAKSAELVFVFGAGSDMTSGTMSTSWAATSDATSCGAQNVNLGDNTSNVFYLTGIQLETDRVTDFEHRSYAQDLQECKRYFQMIVDPSTDTYSDDKGRQPFMGGLVWNKDTKDCRFRGTFNVPMRASPSLYKVVGTAWFRIQVIGGVNTTSDWTLLGSWKEFFELKCTAIDAFGSDDNGMSIYAVCFNSGARVGWSAEL